MLKKFTALLFLICVMFSISTAKTYATFFFTASNISFNSTTGHLSFDISGLPGFYNYANPLNQILITNEDGTVTYWNRSISEGNEGDCDGYTHCDFTLNLSSTPSYPYAIIISQTSGFQVYSQALNSPSIDEVTPTPTATPTPSETAVKIEASPTNGNKIVGQPFSVNVKVNSASESAFNAARAHVAVSSNLTINSIHNATSNVCNLSYTQTPTTTNPSFAGAIYGSSSTGCNVYTMVVTPNATGTGTVTITNGSVKSYEDNSEILDDVTNASFTLGDGPTPTPTGDLSFTITNPTVTYKTNFNLAGIKLASLTHIFVNNSEDDSTYPTSTTWSVPVTLNLGDNNYTIYGRDGTNSTASQTINVNRHILGDINGDGNIDLIDASLFAVDWDKTEDLTYLLSDMNDDGNVDLTDLSILAKLED